MTATSIWIHLATGLQAQVAYSPGSGAVEGNMPYVLSKTVTVYPPDTLTGPATVGFVATPTTVPLGTAAAAQSYISFSPSSLTFASGNSPGQQVTITASMPVLAIPAGTTVKFTWQITTSGWGIQVPDAGYALNASVTAPAVISFPKPTVAIVAPLYNEVFTYNQSALPATIPLTYTVAADASSPITAVDATLDGTPLTVSATGLGTANATVTANMPISTAGTHTIIARGSNANGGSSATSAFIVVVNGTAPTVMIANPANNSTFTIPAGSPTVHVPFDFTAACTQGTLTGVSVTLDSGNLSYVFTSGGLGTTSGVGTAALDMSLASAGSHTVTVQATNQYGSSSASAQFIINGNQLITFNPLPVHTYGDAPFAVSATSSAMLPVTVVSSDSSIASISGNTVTIHRAGTVTLTASQPGTQYISAAAPISQTLTINPAVLAVKADSLAKVYGAPVPPLTATISGFVYGETLATSGVTGAPAVATAATAASGVGLYDILPSLGTLAAANYTFTYVKNSLQVTPATLTVAAQPASKVYGAAVPALNATISGYVNNDGPSAVTGTPAVTTTATTTSAAGTYPIAAAMGSLAAANYTFAFAGSTLTITKATLTFTATGASRLYGDANPSFGYAVTGYVNGDAAATAYTGAPTLVTTAVATSSVAGSPYPITIAAGSLASGNYGFTFVNGSLAIGRATLTVTADNLTKVAGAANPTLTYTVSGFKNGETAAVLSGAPALTTTATQSSTAGNYTITAALGTLAAANYTFTFVNGTLTVTAATPTCGTALVRHAPDFNGNGGLDGSLQLLLPENVTLNGNDWISKDLLVPGTPSTRINGHPTIGGIVDGTGAALPTNYTITFDGIPVLGRLVRRTDPVTIPVVPTPPKPTGTRDVRVNSCDDTVGNFATVRDLTVTGNYGRLVVPAGNYRDLTASGNNGFTLGVPGATQPAIYYVRNLTLNGNATLKIVGPVILTVSDEIDFDGTVGNSDHADWLTLNLYSGDLTMNGSAQLHAYVLAPFGTVRLNGLGKLTGGLKCDRLVVNGNGVVDLCPGNSDSDHSGASGGNGRDDDEHDDDHYGDHDSGQRGGCYDSGDRDDDHRDGYHRGS